ncbi:MULTISPECIES: DUF6069 family protein [Streptomyces]|uniref:Integral membrane protein n=1 Tax=Streptomyces canarius TaxID=285453 RepID=A0ABQ3DAR0_9ACTN|nr:DUF6069 family protein [Streptomyces canarius]GHA65585.1 hypothetical protein GCM10010345_81880 [Streptomyces canarius]
MAGSASYGDVPPYDNAPRGGPGYQSPSGPRSVAAARPWATGAATAVVAALVAVVATMLVRGVLGIAVFAPREAGAWGDATTGYLAAWAAAGAVVATGLLHLLLTVARPRAFFTWIAGLVTVALALLPFTADLALAAELASAAVFLAVGGTVTGLLSGTAYRVVPEPERRNPVTAGAPSHRPPIRRWTRTPPARC